MTKKRAKELTFIRNNIEKTNKELSNLLNISVKTVTRHRKLIKQNAGKSIYVKHKNARNNHSKKYKDDIFNQFITKYNDELRNIINKRAITLRIPLKYFYEDEMQNMKEKPSYSTVIRRTNQQCLMTPYTKKKTKADIKKRISGIESGKIKVKISDHIFAIAKENELRDQNNNRRIISKNALEFGEIVEIDACYEYFIKSLDQKIFIYHAIDASSGKLLAFYADTQETNKGYMKLLEMLFEKYGFPKLIITDKRTTFFNYINPETNMVQELKNRGIQVFSSSIATHKPNVERSFKSSQQFYPLYFFKKKFKSIEDLNSNHNDIINSYNENFKKKVTKNNVFTKAQPEQLRIYLPIKRKFTANCFRIDKKYYTLDKNTFEKTFGIPNTEFVAVLDSDLNIKIRIGNEIWTTREINEEFSRENKKEYDFELLEKKEIEKIIKDTKTRGQSFYKMIDKKISTNKDKFDNQEFELLQKFITINEKILNKMEQWYDNDSKDTR
ncbi:hypothetical protein ACR34G_02925 [Mycoplasma sp. 480]|uniref:hypothetical protein n=1 Tax=Mycoplasma sp. 480 TaxID=3440155 RepID=UPI003F51259B